MNSLTLGFSRTIGGQTEQMEDLSFQKGDFYNIYLHTCAPADIEEKWFEKFFALRIKTVEDDKIELENLYSGEESFWVSLGEVKNVDFKRYGIYSLTLKKVW